MTFPSWTAHRLRAVIKWFRLDRTGHARAGNAPLLSNRAGDAIGGFRTAWEGTVLRAHGHVPRKGKPLRDPKTNSLTSEARRVFAGINLHWHDGHHHADSVIMPRVVPEAPVCGAGPVVEFGPYAA